MAKDTSMSKCPETVLECKFQKSELVHTYRYFTNEGFCISNYVVCMGYSLSRDEISSIADKISDILKRMIVSYRSSDNSDQLFLDF